MNFKSRKSDLYNHISNDSTINSDLLILIQRLNNTDSIAYVPYGPELEPEYLYEASSSSNRNFMATYALQWHAIRMSKEKGCKEYDMFGISPNNDASHPLYGLYKFKTGFGGELYQSLGCWDYPFDEEKYNIFKNVERRNQGYHIN